MLLALEETSADCFHNAGCRFAYVYGFYVRVRLLRMLCTDFAHIVRLLRTYMNFAHVVRILRTYTSFVFTMLNVDSLEGSNFEGSVDLFCPRELLVIHHPNSLEVLLLVLTKQYLPHMRS